MKEYLVENTVTYYATVKAASDKSALAKAEKHVSVDHIFLNIPGTIIETHENGWQIKTRRVLKKKAKKK